MALHLLSIGNDYIGTTSALGGCRNDAVDIAAKFKSYTATSKVLVNSRADRPGVMRAGELFLSRLNKGDLGILAISGHGTREKNPKGGYNEAVVTADFELIWDTELGGLLAHRVPGSVLAVLSDTCHAGGLPRGTSRGLTQAEAITRVPRSIPMSRVKKHKREEGPKVRALPNVIAYLAAKAEEYAYDAEFNGRGNGAMTYHLLRSIDLKSTETFGNIFKKVKKHLPSDQYPQTPQVVASDRLLRKTLGEFKRA